MKYVFFALNIIVGSIGYFLMFLIWKKFLFLDNFNLKIILLFFIFLNILAPYFIYWYDNILSRFLYLLVGLWAGFMLNSVLLASLFFILDLFNIYKINSWSLEEKWLLMFILPLFLIILEAWWAQNIKIKKVSVNIINLPDSWQEKEIVHISDVHLGPIWRQKFFDKLVKKVNTLKAEAIFITGDLFDGNDINFSWFHQRKFLAKRGVFYSFGNHDLILGEEKVKKLLAQLNVEILDNKMIKIDDLQIIGLNCYYKGRLDVKGKILSQVGYNSDKPSILLYHEPKDYQAAKLAGIDLQLSGHTHGGQMFPFNILAKILYRGFNYGFYSFENFSFLITSGVGTWGPPLRLGTNSEIVLIKLLKA